MPNFALLNNVSHKNLRVIRDNTAQYGDNEMSVVTFPQEFRAIQNEYPIFFQKNAETGKFIPNNLAGLYTINEDKLSRLAGDAVAGLHGKGFLECLYMVLASHANVIKLIARIEAKLSNQ